MWSFGVLVWELMSLARAPYSDIESEEVEKFLIEGYRLVQPPGCAQELFEAILQTWQFSPEKRPSSRFMLAKMQQIQNQMIW